MRKKPDQVHREIFDHGRSSGPGKNSTLCDLERLRLPQDFSATSSDKPAIVPVCKPDRHTFIRVHDDESYRLPTYVLEIPHNWTSGFNNDAYVVARALGKALEREIVLKTLFTAITRDAEVFLWPIKTPSLTRQLDPWNRSALNVANRATKQWVRVLSGKGAYEARVAQDDFPEPEWPPASFQELIDRAFEDRVIKSLDHPVIQRLQGGSRS